MKKLFVLASATILLVSACKKDDETTPVVTTPTTPVNTEFGFLVNGTKIVVDSSIAYVDTSVVPNTIEIEAFSNGKYVLFAYLTGNIANQTINEDSNGNYLQYVINLPDTAGITNITARFQSDSGNYSLTKFDLTNKIIAGTFSFVADNSGAGWSGIGTPTIPNFPTQTITEGNLYISNIQYIRTAEVKYLKK